MININFQSECCGCSACAQICPHGCISMNEDIDGFLMPKISSDKCVDCNLCEKVCPVFNSKIETLTDNNIPQNVYAAYNKNEDIRMKSSSGGIFTILAEYAIKKNGVVFGARLSDDCKSVYHCMIENTDDISLLRGSKYVQSDICGTYKEVKNQLDSGRFVLFSGTPCQVEGLIGFLNKKYDNLLLADIICHGVPSSKAWRKYLEYIENKYGEVKNVSFREKSDGWHGGGNVYITLQSNEICITRLENNLYGKAFLSNLSLRKSCYNCKFRKAHHKSDITICDFWGIDEIAPEMNDDKGISVVMINSQKGEKVFESVKDEIICKQTEFLAAEKHNMILKQPPYHKNREKFYEYLDKIDIEKNIKKNIHTHSILVRMTYNFAKRVLKSTIGENNFAVLKKILGK